MNIEPDVHILPYILHSLSTPISTFSALKTTLLLQRYSNACVIAVFCITLFLNYCLLLNHVIKVTTQNIIKLAHTVSIPRTVFFLATVIDTYRYYLVL